MVELCSLYNMLQHAICNDDITFQGLFYALHRGEDLSLTLWEGHRLRAYDRG
jgi:hypothetical protein